MGQGSAPLRIDKFLYFVRLAKSRSKAQELVALGSPRLDGKPVPHAHTEVHIGQTLTFVQNGHVRAIEILALPARRGPAQEAQACYADRIDATPT